ncbi:MAG: glycosyltransferase family 2 protein [Nanoarchaeota archaeon]
MKTSAIITSFKEPKTVGKAIESMLNQKTKRPFDIFVSAPDEETLEVAREYSKIDSRINIFRDSGKGKSLALNQLFKKIKSDILILTDGDVYVNDKAVEEILKLFENPKIGCVTGRPVPMENRKTKYGYWANFLFDQAHKLRKKAFENKEFIECSGYLFAFRKKEINKIPLDVAEDSIIPYIFFEKGYLIGYADKSEVYVKNVNNWKDWIKQKIRTSKAHETLGKYVDIEKVKRVKSFSNESKGTLQLFAYPRTINEFMWSIELAFARLYMWIKVFWDTKIKAEHYGDNWERVNSTK